MAKNVQLKQIMWGYILLCWMSVVFASDLSFAEGIESIPFKAFGYVAILSILGGMAATLPKIINPSIKIDNLYLEIIKDVVMSFVAGLILFFVAIWRVWPWSVTCLLIILGGAGNAKVLDIALNNGFFPRLAQIFGKMPDAAPPENKP